MNSGDLKTYKYVKISKSNFFGITILSYIVYVRKVINELQNFSETIPFSGKILGKRLDLSTIKICRTFLILILKIKILKLLFEMNNNNKKIQMHVKEII